MRQEWLEQLAQLLDEQVAQAERLAEALATEKTALTGADADALNRATHDKEVALNRFEQLEQERRLFCQAGHVGPTRAAFDQFIGALGHVAHAALASRWQRLLLVTGACRDANRVNGAITQFKQRQILHMLGLLRGGTAAPTYGASGATTAGGITSRALASV